jgi:hypothetical protein
VFIADFLRAFGEAGVDALMLDEVDGHAADIATYQSVLNLAAHYRWDIVAPGAPHPNLRFERIAPDAQPEQVLQRLATLR